MPYFRGFQQSYARFFIPFLFGQRNPQVPIGQYPRSGGEAVDAVLPTQGFGCVAGVRLEISTHN